MPTDQTRIEFPVYLIDFVDFSLSVNVGIVVGQGEESVVLQEIVDNVHKLVWISGLRKSPVLDLIDDLGQLGATVVEVHGVVAPCFQDFHLELLIDLERELKRIRNIK